MKLRIEDSSNLLWRINVLKRNMTCSCRKLCVCLFCEKKDVLFLIKDRVFLHYS